MRYKTTTKRHAVAGSLGIARRIARRHRRDLRFRLPRLRLLRRRSWRAITPTTPAASSWPCWKACAPAQSRPTDIPPWGRRVERRIDELRAAIEQEAVRLRPALPAPSPVDGTFAVRRIHRRSRSQHANQRRLRQHHAGGLAGGGLDSRRTLQPRDRHLGRRCHLRPSDRMDRRRLPGQRARRHRRSGRRSRHSLRPPPSWPDHGHGRRGSGGRERRRRARTRNPAHLRGVERGHAPTAPSTAPVSMCSTSAR